MVKKKIRLGAVKSQMTDDSTPTGQALELTGDSSTSSDLRQPSAQRRSSKTTLWLLCVTLKDRQMSRGLRESEGEN